MNNRYPYQNSSFNKQDETAKHLAAMQKINQLENQRTLMKMAFTYIEYSSSDPIIYCMNQSNKIFNIKAMAAMMKNQERQYSELINQFQQPQQQQQINNNRYQVQNQQNQGPRINQQNNRNQQNVSVNVNLETLKCPLSGGKNNFYQKISLPMPIQLIVVAIILKSISQSNGFKIIEHALFVELAPTYKIQQKIMHCKKLLIIIISKIDIIQISCFWHKIVRFQEGIFFFKVFKEFLNINNYNAVIIIMIFFVIEYPYVDFINKSQQFYQQYKISIWIKTSPTKQERQQIILRIVNLCSSSKENMKKKREEEKWKKRSRKESNDKEKWMSLLEAQDKNDLQYYNIILSNMFQRVKYFYTLPYKFKGLQPTKNTRAAQVLKQMNFSDNIEKGFIYAYDQLIQAIAEDDQEFIQSNLESDLSKRFISGLQELNEKNKAIILEKESITHNMSIHEFWIFSKSQETNEKDTFLRVSDDRPESHMMKILFGRGVMNLNFSIKCFIKSPYYLNLEGETFSNSHHLIGFTNAISFEQLAQQLTTLDALYKNALSQGNWMIYSFDNLKD